MKKDLNKDLNEMNEKTRSQLSEARKAVKDLDARVKGFEDGDARNT